MRELKIRVHEIALDGLPPPEMHGVAFIHDGCVVSGWPLRPDEFGIIYQTHGVDPSGPVLWEADSDVGHNGAFVGVTHWIQFSELPVIMHQNGKDADGREYEEFGDAKPDVCL